MEPRIDTSLKRPRPFDISEEEPSKRVRVEAVPSIIEKTTGVRRKLVFDASASPIALSARPLLARTPPRAFSARPLLASTPPRAFSAGPPLASTPPRTPDLGFEPLWVDSPSVASPIRARTPPVEKTRSYLGSPSVASPISDRILIEKLEALLGSPYKSAAPLIRIYAENPDDSGAPLIAQLPTLGTFKIRRLSTEDNHITYQFEKGQTISLSSIKQTNYLLFLIRGRYSLDNMVLKTINPLIDENSKAGLIRREKLLLNGKPGIYFYSRDGVALEEKAPDDRLHSKSRE